MYLNSFKNKLETHNSFDIRPPYFKLLVASNSPAFPREKAARAYFSAANDNS